MSQIVNRRDLDFLMYEMLGVEKLLDAPRFAAYDRSAITQILDTAQGMAEHTFLPIAAVVDDPEGILGRIQELFGLANEVGRD